MCGSIVEEILFVGVWVKRGVLFQFGKGSTSVHEASCKELEDGVGTLLIADFLYPSKFYICSSDVTRCFIRCDKCVCVDYHWEVDESHILRAWSGATGRGGVSVQ